MGHKGLHLTVWINRLCLAFRAERQNKSICSPANWPLFGSLILLQDVKEQKIAPKWPGSQTNCCMLFISGKKHGISHDIWQTREFSIWWTYVNIWHIALNPRSSGGVLKTNKWHRHSCFKVTLRFKQYPSTVFIWSCHSLLLTCLGCSLFGEACNKARVSGGISALGLHWVGLRKQFYILSHL